MGAPQPDCRKQKINPKGADGRPPVQTCTKWRQNRGLTRGLDPDAMTTIGLLQGAEAPTVRDRPERHLSRSLKMDEHKLFAQVGTWMALGAVLLAVAAPLLGG